MPSYSSKSLSQEILLEHYPTNALAQMEKAQKSLWILTAVLFLSFDITNDLEAHQLGPGKNVQYTEHTPINVKNRTQGRLGGSVKLHILTSRSRLQVKA